MGTLEFSFPSDRAPEEQGKPRSLKYVAVGVVVLLAAVAVAFLVNPPSRAESQITSTVVVNTPGMHGSHIVAVGSIMNKSLTFYSGDKIGVRIALTYLAFPGDPNSLRIVSVNDSDGLSIWSITPSLPTTLTGSPRGIVLIILVVAPASSYTGDLHLNVNNS